MFIILAICIDTVYTLPTCGIKNQFIANIIIIKFMSTTSKVNIQTQMNLKHQWYNLKKLNKSKKKRNAYVACHITYK